MQFQKINRTNAEQVFGVCKNVTGGTVSANYPVCFATGAGSADGYSVVAPATGNLVTFAGIADADMGDNGVGLYQCYGYRDSVRIFATGTSGTVATGVVMGPNAGSNGVNSTGLLSEYGPVISMVAIGAAINSPGGYAAAFIRAL